MNLKLLLTSVRSRKKFTLFEARMKCKMMPSEQPSELNGFSNFNGFDTEQRGLNKARVALFRKQL